MAEQLTNCRNGLLRRDLSERVSAWEPMCCGRTRGPGLLIAPFAKTDTMEPPTSQRSCCQSGSHPARPFSLPKAFRICVGSLRPAIAQCERDSRTFASGLSAAQRSSLVGGAIYELRTGLVGVWRLIGEFHEICAICVTTRLICAQPFVQADLNSQLKVRIRAFNLP